MCVVCVLCVCVWCVCCVYVVRVCVCVQKRREGKLVSQPPHPGVLSDLLSICPPKLFSKNQDWEQQVLGSRGGKAGGWRAKAQAPSCRKVRQLYLTPA